MDNKCDLFLVTPTNSKELRYLSLLDKNFSYKSDATYEGYMGVSVNRVKLIPLIALLRKQNVFFYSVPVSYKNSKLISKELAFGIAGEYAKTNDLSVIFDSSLKKNDNPLIWTFGATTLTEEKAGGLIMVDKLDGHIWSLDELDAYMYDYNNIY
jgi:hypothetical protein